MDLINYLFERDLSCLILWANGRLCLVQPDLLTIEILTSILAREKKERKKDRESRQGKPPGYLDFKMRRKAAGLDQILNC